MKVNNGNLTPEQFKSVMGFEVRSYKGLLGGISYPTLGALAMTYNLSRGQVTLEDFEDYLRQQDAMQRELIFTEIGLNLASAIGHMPDVPENDTWKVDLPNNGKTPLENGPYIKDGKPNGRPTLSGKKKVEFEQTVYDKQVDPDGVLRDPNTGEILDWKPGERRDGKVDFGHTGGNSYNKMFEEYKNRNISLDELKDFQFNPDNYRIESPSSNRGHQYE